MRISLIMNNGLAVDDYPQPETWADLASEMGLSQVEYFADHIEPMMFAGVVRRQSEFLIATREALAQRGLRVFSVGTGRCSYMLNMLAHPYGDMRAAAQEGMRAAANLAAALGAKYLSGHYDCISRDDWRANPVSPAPMAWVRTALADLACEVGPSGLAGIFIEQMHRPQLQPNTIAGLHDWLDDLGHRVASHPGAARFYPQLDVGHAAHVTARDDPRHGPRDKDPIAWLAEPFGRGDLVLVHLQQTDRGGSRHWPFTAADNARGIITAAPVIAALRASGVAHAVCSLEVFFPRGSDWPDMRAAMLESVAYWRTALVTAGFVESAPGEFTDPATSPA